MAARPIPIAPTFKACAAAILAVSFALGGCMSYRVPFTRDIRTQYELKSEDLKKLQFYVSGDIILQREFLREEGEVSPSHKLVAKEAGLLEQVIVRDRTPGIATEVGDTYIAVSFEPGESLVFGSSPTDKDPDRKYKLSAKRWVDGNGEILYGGKTFYAVGWSRAAYLEVLVESLDAVKREKKVLPGMTLPSN